MRISAFQMLLGPRWDKARVLFSPWPTNNSGEISAQSQKWAQLKAKRIKTKNTEAEAAKVAAGGPPTFDTEPYISCLQNCVASRGELEDLIAVFTCLHSRTIRTERGCPPSP